MKERPILFSAPMIRALLAGTKTQTRRVTKPQPGYPDGGEWVGGMHEGAFYFGPPIKGDPQNWVLDNYTPCPYGLVGDRLWVRECFYIDLIPYSDQGPLPKVRPAELDEHSTYYRADGECCEQIPECACAEVGKPRWRPSIHMPRWASRITLEVTSVGFEQLQEISRGDCMAEGCPFPNVAKETDPKRWYADLWESINGPGSWNANPWVWVVEFKRVMHASAA